MSAPLRLTPADLRSLADALEDLTKVRREHDVDIAGYGQYEVRLNAADVSVSLSWDDEHGYVVDDRVGG
ncbi:MAG: hypothetical protein ABWX71_04805 [Aeromicrobium sp.]